MRQSSALVFFSTIFLFFLCYIRTQSRFQFSSKNPGIKTMEENYDAWHSCFMNNISHFEGYPDELWDNMFNGIRRCEYIKEMKYLPILDFLNSDEAKRHILPKMNQPSTIVTLGIGHDTGAEEKLLQQLPEGSEFFGADPMHEINENLYTSIPGKYFPFAVGAAPGLAEANVLIDTSYTTKTVVNVDIIYFLTKLINRTVIDDLWMDAEGAEYGMFEFFYNGGEFDKNNIKFCQINIEIHVPDTHQKKLIHDFIFQLMKDRRYAIFRPVKGKHMRLYLLNFKDDNCAHNYIL
ncbi:Methyltransferase FkbM domain-containing protein [Caenorhabditis elegans]|uniref:Methyltransferase FkbM domain-containing protein n=1 Tax=Caenorhabditis elegans TaxID=6239 RepID=O16534_CAEEL|nr:Methyltransferase FkbM domain-containing protein [Caenorhabditis elegans]CCD64795.1 Methyltransferase FkbM domain-containing protein [Caenorhabditis elegans]|eukprot:NP_494668.1 Uncharacterized protein CELE_C17A2.7 [Caenorhabditis elegans]